MYLEIKRADLCSLAIGLSVLASGAAAVPLNYTFNTRVDQVFNLDTFSVDPSSSFVGTTGTATLQIDDSQLDPSLFLGSFEYLATSSAFDINPDFALTHDFGSGAQTFYGENDVFQGGAQFYFGDDPDYPVLDVFYDVADDDLFTAEIEDIINEPGIIDFSAIGFDQDTQTILLEVQAVASDIAPVPLPASGLILLTGLGTFAAVRRRRGV